MNSAIPPELDNDPIIRVIRNIVQQGKPRQFYAQVFEELAIAALKRNRLHDFVAFSAICFFCTIEQENQQQSEEDAQSKRMSPLLN